MQNTDKSVVTGSISIVRRGILGGNIGYTRARLLSHMLASRVTDEGINKGTNCANTGGGVGGDQQGCNTTASHQD